MGADGPAQTSSCITGDLVARPGGEAAFRRAPARSARRRGRAPTRCWATTTSARATTRSRPGTRCERLDGVDLLGAERRVLELRGRRVCLVGADPIRWARDSSYEVAAPLDRTADLRVLLCHFPNAFDLLRPGDFQSMLAGHIHGGQICLPWPTGRIGLAHPTERYLRGTFGRDGTVMHLSPGLGTTFLPLRILAPPEATLLTLRRPG